MDIKLSANFSLKELTRSYQADRHGIINTPGPKEISSLQHLCRNILQPLRNHYAHPITVSSGYRCPELNRIVGGVTTSQHLRGEAADLVFPDLPTAINWMHFILHNCQFDQMLLEQNQRTGARWLHVSCRPDHSCNRHEIKIIQVK